MSSDKTTAIGKAGVQIILPFARAYFLMLALGGLAHQLHHSWLAIGYWSSWLVAFIALMLQTSKDE